MEAKNIFHLTVENVKEVKSLSEQLSLGKKKIIKLFSKQEAPIKSQSSSPKNVF